MATTEKSTAGKTGLRDRWPVLPVAEWQDTRDTLHMWTQVVGKIRLALAPLMNHWWEVPLYVSARGLTTSPMPYDGGIFEIEFDFLAHQLIVRTSEDTLKTLKLEAKPVADFYAELMGLLRGLGITPKLWPMPVEIPNPVRFDQDRIHAGYDPEYANRFWRVLVASDTVFKEFRCPFLGKSSPVHFFWGSFDLAVTRFSGRRAPERPGADSITREAYSHEVISVGFWPGTGATDAVFYSYAAPAPQDFALAAVKPAAAFYSKEMSEFLLPYETVRKSHSPEGDILAFAQSTYEAGASLGRWDRTALERENDPTHG